eukprot:CAMPEP_0113404768 /NCGR_PEP_ID=MMETSP0013_2-20120614/18578_1 /TAXON_ID=2843 ORGANISM="Skeletonema costatum, Strain 1716" /NCGR_SAMPLE_ID=MMETSP0013_2 /ASSEMBLY_ACC=CAM_ASM_000158 /LENGTH=172 /DNA_ID=CAMNT_0000290417 /DNA_START=89 /DNA_END=607 /DNA_ORIENTATION=+ /assembly_acc=CAM_ASM_000158
MKLSPISNEPSVAVAVVADEENVITTKNDFVTAPREDDEDVDTLHSSSSSSRWTKRLIAGVIALVAVVTLSVALPTVNTREAEDAALQITFGKGKGKDQSSKNVIADNPCSECSITNDTNNFCGLLGIRTFMDACESQTECKEQGLECKLCSTVEGFDGDDVGGGAYVCLEK